MKPLLRLVLLFALTATAAHAADAKLIAAGPGIVLMKDRAIFTKKPKNGDAKVINDLNYLAVWREEGGKGRFLAWQSNKLPPLDGATK